MPVTLTDVYAAVAGSATEQPSSLLGAADILSPIVIPGSQTSYADVKGAAISLVATAGVIIDIGFRATVDVVGSGAGGQGRADFQVIDEAANVYELMRWAYPNNATDPMLTFSGRHPFSPAAGAHAYRLQARVQNTSSGFTLITGFGSVPTGPRMWARRVG